MPGYPPECRPHALHYLQLAETATTPESRQEFIALAETWKQLAAELDADEALLQTIADLELNEPYNAVPTALNLHSWAA